MSPWLRCSVTQATVQGGTNNANVNMTSPINGAYGFASVSSQQQHWPLAEDTASTGLLSRTTNAPAYSWALHVLLRLTARHLVLMPMQPPDSLHRSHQPCSQLQPYLTTSPPASAGDHRRGVGD